MRRVFQVAARNARNFRVRSGLMGSHSARIPGFGVSSVTVGVLGAAALAAAGVGIATCAPMLRTRDRDAEDFDSAQDMPTGVAEDAYWLPMGKEWHLGKVTAYIENPKGSTNKYEYDHDTHKLALDRVLHTAISYPMDYGFVPRTLSEDGDALDICVISFFPLLPESIATVRVVGVLLMEDEKGIDEKLLAVVDSDPRAEQFQTLSDLPPHVKKEISHFFQRYKDLEPGKWAKVGAWLDKGDALEIIRNCHKRFLRYYGRSGGPGEQASASGKESSAEVKQQD